MAFKVQDLNLIIVPPVQGIEQEFLPHGKTARQPDTIKIYCDVPYLAGPVAQLVASPTADPAIMSSILAQSHTFVEIDHEIISTVILLRLIRVVVSYMRKYVHEVLVNRLVKLAQEKVGELN